MRAGGFLGLPGLFKVFAFSAAFFAASAWADTFDGRVSEAVRLQYRDDLPYDKILQTIDFESPSCNRKVRLEISFKGISAKPLAEPYGKFLSKFANDTVSFKGSLPNLPLFVSETKSTFVKRLLESKPGEKFFVYATVCFAWTPGPKGNVRSVFLLVDDLLTADEELAFADFRRKYGVSQASGSGQPQPPPVQPPAKDKTRLVCLMF